MAYKHGFTLLSDLLPVLQQQQKLVFNSLGFGIPNKFVASSSGA